MSEISFPELFGGVACLDFANSLDGRATERPEEYLNSYADLVAWAEYAGLITPSTAALLPRGEAPGTLRTALELREAIFQAFTAIARDAAAPAPALAVIQDRYTDAMATARLIPGEGSFDWEFSGDAPDRVWWPVALSAVRLLTTGPLDRVKLCAAEAGCVGLFLDTSKNRSRRWCTMDGCGVEAKIQRQAKRRQSARAARP